MKMFEDSFPAFKMTLLIVSLMKSMKNAKKENHIRQSSKLQHIRRTGRNCTF